MKAILVVMMFLVSSVAIASERYEIQPRYTDFTPGDGFMDAGSRTNPYEVKSHAGGTIGTIQPRFKEWNK